jgi:aspartyl-tRNA(Asn)/glutamyl-tRNA(Gln) amidotransferase subunit A
MKNERGLLKIIDISERGVRGDSPRCRSFSIQGPEQIEGKKAAPFQWITSTYQFNMTGQPAATVPAGFTKDGLPIGLQIVGRHLDDALVLRAAAADEAAAPWKDKWPPMLAQMGL